MKRIKQFRIILIFVQLVALCMPLQAQNSKPNILFVLVDDQRADALGAMGNSYIHTPHIDKLAGNGILFKNTYIMGANHGAVCAPSRAMLMTGLALNRVYQQLGEVTEEEWETREKGKYQHYPNALVDKLILPQLLRQNGYITFGTGKWHASQKAFKNGFEKGKAVFFGGMDDHFNTNFRDLNTDGSFSKHPEQGFSTDVITDAALDFIEEYVQEENDRPFFAHVSYTAPHDPRSPAKKYIDFYRQENIPVPANLMSQHPFSFENGALLENRSPMTMRDEQTGAWPRTPEQIRQQLADYYGLISHIDEKFGQMMNALDSLHLLENTIVIYTSDNGLAIGSHGLLGKQSLYEHCMKVPLIISGPGVPRNKTTEALVSLLDLYPSICEMLELEAPEGLDGKSILPIIQGKKDAVREVMFTQYWDFIRAVRDDRYKLITYPMIHHTQLFDLKDDPYELNNLADRPEYKKRVEEMKARMITCKKAAKDNFPMFTDKVWPKAYSLEGVERKPDVHQPRYILDKYFNEPVKN